MEGIEVSILKKRRAILEILPHPISEHLRKLLVEREADSGQIFFDKLGPERLHQLVATYKSIIELPAFILLAQLWDVLVESSGEIDISSHQLELLKQYLNIRSHQRIQNIYFQLIPVTIEIFKQNKVPLFVEEFAELKANFNHGSDFFNSCMFLKTLVRRRVFLKMKRNNYALKEKRDWQRFWGLWHF